ncbi:MAG: glutathione S-transferase family protein [Candidatus Binatia bacterium]
MPTLHGVDGSPFVRKVKVACIEKGITFDQNPVMPMGVSDDYKKISPLGKIPCWTTDEGENIPDSSCILSYLDAAHPEKSLHPSDPVKLGQALFLEEYGDSRLVENCGPVFFQRIINPRLLKLPTDEAVVEKCLTEGLPPLLAWLEEQTAGKDYLVGSSLSVADLGIASPLVNLAHAGETIDASKYPNLARYAAGILERDSFRQCIEAERAVFGG